MRHHVLDKPQLYQWTLKAARSLPRPLLYGLARVVGGLVFIFSRRDRTNMRHNLDAIFDGAMPPGNRLGLIWRIFQNYALYMVDFFRLLGMPSQESLDSARLYEGRLHLDEALALKRGVILMTAHLGHWEIGGLGLRALGYPINVVAIKHNTTFTNNLINTLRARHGIRVIELGDSAYDTLDIIKALRRNEIVAVLGDRVLYGRSGATTLFGRQVQFPVGPLLMAMATGAPVVPAFSVLDPHGRYRGIIEPPLDLCNGPDREEALRENLRRVAVVFERYIRRYPDQWYQFERLG